MSPPRPDESFLDKIVIDAGGRRLTDEERANDEAENADYILDEYVIEAKDIQEELFSKEECHHKIARNLLAVPRGSRRDPNRAKHSF